MPHDDEQRKQHEEAAINRASLRRERIAAREALSAAEHAEKTTQMLDHLRAFLQRRAPVVLGFYWPIRAEPDCRALVAELLPQGWRACLPVIIERTAAMTFHEWTPDSHMVAGEHGIPTVACGRELKPEVLLLPVNAFDAAGYRLGYGGGYFDRTLAAMAPPPYTIGVGFELARTTTIAPHAQDCRLDAVVTEAGIDFFPGGI